MASRESVLYAGQTVQVALLILEHTVPSLLTLDLAMSSGIKPSAIVNTLKDVKKSQECFTQDAVVDIPLEDAAPVGEIAQLVPLILESLVKRTLMLEEALIPNVSLEPQRSVPFATPTVPAASFPLESFVPKLLAHLISHTFAVIFSA